jgi:Amt family ammonium transporter
MTGVFATKSVNPAGNDGLFCGNSGLHISQSIAVLATVASSATVTFLLEMLSLREDFRSTEEHQIEGLDLVEQGEKGYHKLL